MLSVDFSYRAGTADSYDASRGGPGGWDPGDPPEMEIETIFWPVVKWDAAKREFVPDHIEMPYNALPSKIADAIEIYILENYEPDYGYDDDWGRE